MARDEEAPTLVAPSVFSPPPLPAEIWAALGELVSRDDVEEMSEGEWEAEEDALWVLPTVWSSASLALGEVVSHDPDWQPGARWDGDVDGDEIAGGVSENHPPFGRIDADGLARARSGEAPVHLVCRYI